MVHLLIINGWFVPATLWRDFTEDVAIGYEVQIIDLDKDFPLDQNLAIAQYIELIDKYVRSNTLILGWSLGGMLASYYSSRTEKVFLGLMTLQSNPCFLTQSDWPNAMNRGDFQSLKNLVSDQDAAALVKRFFHLLVTGSPQRKQDRRYLKEIFSKEQQQPFDVLNTGLMMLETLDVRHELKNIKSPCCHVYGEQDALVPVSVVDSVQSLAPSHQIRTVKGMGHFALGAYRTELMQVLNDFVLSINSGELA